MRKVEHKSKEEIVKIGRKIVEAFAAEKAGIVTLLTEEQTVKAFEIMTDYFYRAGVLYSTSETGEGYLPALPRGFRPAGGFCLLLYRRQSAETEGKYRLFKPDSGR